MKNIKLVICALLMSLILINLNGCQEPPFADDGSWVPGNWTSVVRSDDREHGEVFTIVTKITYDFRADGTGSINDYGWCAISGGEWEVAGMGYVETYFAYTLEGDTLTITHTGSEFGDYPEDEQNTRVYTVSRNQDGSITWTNAETEESRIYRKVDHTLSVTDLLLLFELDPNVPEN